MTSPWLQSQGPGKKEGIQSPVSWVTCLTPLFYPTMPRQFWALGSETKHASAHSLSWLLSSFPGLGFTSCCVLPIRRGAKSRVL